MSYTEEQARIDVGLSLDPEVAREASLKKWYQLASPDPDGYAPNDPCGYCFVAKNHAIEASANYFTAACNFCPAIHICVDVDLNEVDPNDMIAAIKDLQHTEVAP